MLTTLRLLIGVAPFIAFVNCTDANPVAPPVEDEEVISFVSVMNDYRVSLGCPVIEWHGEVAAVAEAHSADMIERNFFGHMNPDGRSPFDRLAEADLEYSRAAENIAAGFSTGDGVFDAWLDSSGHRANIENCSLTHHGVGKVDRHWTHLFITPR